MTCASQCVVGSVVSAHSRRLTFASVLSRNVFSFPGFGGSTIPGMLAMMRRAYTKGCAWGSRSLLPVRPQLERPDRGGRMPGRHLDRLVQVGTLKDGVAGDLLLGLGEWAVGHQHLTIPHAQGRRFADGPEAAPANQHPTGHHLGIPGVYLYLETCLVF